MRQCPVHDRKIQFHKFWEANNIDRGTKVLREMGQHSENNQEGTSRPRKGAKHQSKPLG
jgi:hypothetical protein